MKNTLHYQKGSARTATIALVILIILLAGAAGVYYSYSNKPLEATADGTMPNYSSGDTINTGEIVTSTTTLKTVYTPEHTIVRTVPASPFPGGAIYRNPLYDLTVNLPASYQGYTVTEGNDSYAGVPNNVSTHFTAPNGNNFTINVFSMEQWNKIRTIENAAHQNVNSFGEGEYLGENFHFIYSSYGSEPQLQTILDQVRFY